MSTVDDVKIYIYIYATYICQYIKSMSAVFWKDGGKKFELDLL